MQYLVIIENLVRGISIEFGSSFDDASPGESLEVSCLRANQKYWILVDGQGLGRTGIFTLQIEDAGDITPITNIDTTICAETTFSVGNSIYDQSGNYEEIINLYEGCDSIVYTNLTVLDPVEVSVNIEKPGIGLGTANGQASAMVTGGDGVYSYLWSNGETTERVTNFVGNQEYCLTVTDAHGCSDEICLVMELKTIISPTFSHKDLDCNGDQNGAINFAVSGGIAPYNYSWEQLNGSSKSIGVVDADNQDTEINNLAGGTYEIRIQDGFGDTIFIVDINEPEALVINQNGLVDASCFGSCDGEVDVQITGGSGNYTINWNDNNFGSTLRNGLCAGNYELTVSDSKGCQEFYQFEIKEPEEFILTPVVEKEVSCFGGNDGIAMVTTNGSPSNYAWNNSVSTASNPSLSAGNYIVTVTNSDGCTAITNVVIPQPEAPLSAEIQVEKSISCAGENDGRLRAIVFGPGENFQYSWSNGSDQRIPSNLAPGAYSVIITNEKGCETNAEYELTEPESLEVEYVVQPITCLEGAEFGTLNITNISGGTPGYQFSLNNGPFQQGLTFDELLEGEYNLDVKDGAGCRLGYQFFVEGPPNLQVELGEDQTVSLGDLINITATANEENIDYQWYRDGEPLDETSNQLVDLQLIDKGLFKVEVFDPVTLCEAEDDIFIQVRKQRRVFIPTAFSPNNDDVNETLMVYGGPEVALIKTFRIFDRNGAMIYEADNFQSESEKAAWDGNFNGHQMPTGPYAYYAVVEFIDGETKVIKGEVLLKR